jgi:hypothetical protein
MDQKGPDQSVLSHIQELIEEEHRLYEGEKGADQKRLGEVQVQLDQCWDLLRRRRALRQAGRNPDEAHVRPPEVVEKYEQ